MLALLGKMTFMHPPHAPRDPCLLRSDLHSTTMLCTPTFFTLGPESGFQIGAGANPANISPLSTCVFAFRSSWSSIKKMVLWTIDPVRQTFGGYFLEKGEHGAATTNHRHPSLGPLVFDVALVVVLATTPRIQTNVIAFLSDPRSISNASDHASRSSRSRGTCTLSLSVTGQCTWRNSDKCSPFVSKIDSFHQQFKAPCHST